MTHAPVATIDFETRSACSLKKSGVYKYAIDPTTQIQCLAFRLPDWPTGRTGLWHPAMPHLGWKEADHGDITGCAELFYWILDGGLVEAHMAWFERYHWQAHMVARYGWPAVGHEQWRCSAAKAASHSLPRGLDEALSALKSVVRKDADGHTLMRKMSQPRKALKAELWRWDNDHGAGKCMVCKGKGTYKRKPCENCEGRGEFTSCPPSEVPPMPVLWHETAEEYLRLFAYCRQDILAEEELSSLLPDLSPAETTLYLLDQEINERGFCLDRAAVDAALRLIARETEELNGELTKLTGGAVSRATERAKMLEWFKSQGLFLPNTQRAVLEQTLKDVTGSGPDASRATPEIVRGLEIVLALGKSSTAKYERMRDWISPDDRVRGGLLYHGASTGRWTGAGVQPHNFPRGRVKDIEATWEALKTEDSDTIEAAYDDVMTTLSHSLRGCIIPSPGKQLFVVDFASIEARGLMWLAQDEDALDIFRRGEDIYCSMASTIYGIPVSKADKERRAVGKVAILGLGYQMGWEKFIATAATAGVTLGEDMARSVVDAYRTRFYKIKNLWNYQEEAAIRAVRSGKLITRGRISWWTEGNFLYCRLPSGRRLAYPFPEVRSTVTPWGSERPQLTFMGINPHTHQWNRLSTYGGMLVENQVQALSRDLLADAMLRVKKSKTYTPILSVHDEIIAEAPPYLGDVKEFERLVCRVEPWAKGLPVEAEGWAGYRYRK